MADHTRAAAEIIAAEARRIAARYSETIPPSIHVSGVGDRWSVIADAPAAYPNEVLGVRHPVFGNRHVWVTDAYRPFLAPATDAKADAAAEEIGKTVDDWTKERGFA
jgi:hypothetical protein